MEWFLTDTRTQTHTHTCWSHYLYMCSHRSESIIIMQDTCDIRQWAGGKFEEGGVGGCQLLRCVSTKASSRRACAEGLSAGFLGEREGRVHSWVACVGALLSPDEAAHGEGSEGGREVTGGSRDGLANADLEHGRLGWQLRPEREAGRWLVRGALPLARWPCPPPTWVAWWWPFRARCTRGSRCLTCGRSRGHR